jgi:hypothetical protein
MSLWTSVASRRSHHAGARGGGADHAGSLPSMVTSLALDPALAANDNQAPPLFKLRRLIFVTTAALAMGWLFWVGLLR